MRSASVAGIISPVKISSLDLPYPISFTRREQPPGARDEADVVFAKTETRLVGSDADVARQGYLKPGPGAGAVDRGKHGFFDQLKLVEELREPVVFGAELRRVPVALEVLDVAAGGEGAALPREDDHADLFVGLKLGEQTGEVIAHLFVNCVEAVGPVKRDGRDAI